MPWLIVKRLLSNCPLWRIEFGVSAWKQAPYPLSHHGGLRLPFRISKEKKLLFRDTRCYVYDPPGLPMGIILLFFSSCPRLDSTQSHIIFSVLQMNAIFKKSAEIWAVNLHLFQLSPFTYFRTWIEGCLSTVLSNSNEPWRSLFQNNPPVLSVGSLTGPLLS